MLVEVKVSGVAFDQANFAFIVFLQEIEGNRVLPIWIGQPEAQAIIMALYGETPPRPMTHDLFRNVLNRFGIAVEKIVIHKIENEVFYASLYTKQNGRSEVIDSRPSDAIALALRMNAPIYVTQEVFERAAIERPAFMNEEGEGPTAPPAPGSTTIQ